MNAAKVKFRKVEDFKFPHVAPQASKEDIAILAEGIAKSILCIAKNGDAVLVQGEMTLTYAIVNELKKSQKNMFICAATTDRIVEEISEARGISEKKVSFKFHDFREY